MLVKIILLGSILAYIVFAGLIFWYLKRRYAKEAFSLVIEDDNKKNKFKYNLKKEKAYFEIKGELVHISFDKNIWKVSTGDNPAKEVVCGEKSHIVPGYTMTIIDRTNKTVCFEAGAWLGVAIIMLAIIIFVSINIAHSAGEQNSNLAVGISATDNGENEQAVDSVVDETDMSDDINQNPSMEDSVAEEYELEKVEAEEDAPPAVEPVDGELKKREMLATHISAGVRYSLAITNGGVKIAFADKNSGFDFSDWNDLVSISGMTNVILGLKKNGDVYSTCLNDFLYDSDVSSWHDIIQISAGNQFAVGLDYKGNVISIGRSEDGQREVEDWENIKQIATAQRLTVGLDEDGNLHFAGLHAEEFEQQYNSSIDEWKNVIRIYAAGGMKQEEMGHVVGLKSDRTIVVLGDDFEPSTMSVDEIEDVRLLAVGDHHLVAITNNDEIVVWGDAGTIDYHGQNEKEKFDNWPCEDIVELSAGYDLTLAVTSKGDVYAAGNERQGQLGANEWINVMQYPEEQ